jgi:hypothetical protein
MASKVKADFSEIRKAAEALSQAQVKAFIGTVAKEVAARYLRKAAKKTPVDEGNLRRSWDVEVADKGGGCEITLTNSSEYASYVEYGHRQTPGRFVPAIGKRLKKSWVEGKLFLTKSEMEMEKELPKVIEKKLEAWLKEVIGS